MIHEHEPSSDYDRKVLISSKRLCLSKENVVGISFSLGLSDTTAHSKTDLSLIGESGESDKHCILLALLQSWHTSRTRTTEIPTSLLALLFRIASRHCSNGSKVEQLRLLVYRILMCPVRDLTSTSCFTGVLMLRL